MLKVAKFGGSSMADAGQYQKIRDIIRSDPSRRVVVVSAAGKRSAGDNKITDLLYLCYAHLQYGVSCDGIYQMIRERYGDIHRELGLRVDLEGVLDRLRSQMEQGISRDELVSRGEYLSALLMADYLGFDSIAYNTYDAGQIFPQEAPIETGGITNAIAIHTTSFIEEIM